MVPSQTWLRTFGFPTYSYTCVTSTVSIMWISLSNYMYIVSIYVAFAKIVMWKCIFIVVFGKLSSQIFLCTYSVLCVHTPQFHSLHKYSVLCVHSSIPYTNIRYYVSTVPFLAQIFGIMCLQFHSLHKYSVLCVYSIPYTNILYYVSTAFFTQRLIL